MAFVTLSLCNNIRVAYMAYYLDHWELNVDLFVHTA